MWKTNRPLEHIFTWISNAKQFEQLIKSTAIRCESIMMWVYYAKKNSNHFELIFEFYIVKNEALFFCNICPFVHCYMFFRSARLFAVLRHRVFANIIFIQRNQVYTYESITINEPFRPAQGDNMMVKSKYNTMLCKCWINQKYIFSLKKKIKFLRLSIQWTILTWTTHFFRLKKFWLWFDSLKYQEILNICLQFK